MRRNRSVVRRAGPLARAWRVVSLCALAGILVAGGLSMLSVLNSATRHLDRLLVRAIEQGLHRAARVETVEVLQPGKIRVTGLAIANGSTFEDGVLLDVPEAEVRYEFWDLVRGRVDPVGSIASGVIRRPSLLIVRSRDNHFNLQDLFPKRRRPPKPSPFRGTVRVEGGTVRFVDYAVRDLPAPQINVLSALTATVDAGAPPLIAATLAADAGERAGRITARGTFEPETGGFTFQAGGDSDRLGYWAHYLAAVRGLDVQAGRGTAEARIWKAGARTPIELTANVWFRDGVARTPYVAAPLTGAAGRVTVRTGKPLETAVELTAMAAGIRVGASGSVFTGEDGRLALAVRADGVELSEVRQLTTVAVPEWLRPMAPATVQAQVYGPTSSPNVLANVQLPRAVLYNTTVENVQARIRYQDDVIYIPSLTGTSMGRVVTARGQYDLRTKAIRLIAGVPGVSASALGLKDLPLTGNVATRLMVTGTAGAPEAGVLVTMTNGRIQNIPYDRVVARVNLAGRTLRIEEAVATLPGATVRARGNVSLDGPLDLRVSATGVRLGRLLPAAGFAGVSGTAFFDGVVDGTMSNPQVRGDARIFNANVRGNHVDFAAGRVGVSRHAVHLRDVTVARYPAQGVLSGVATVRRDGRVALDMVAKLQAGRLEALLRDAGVSPLAEGYVRTPNNVTIGGTLASPIVEGRVLVTDGNVRGYPVSQASAHFRYSGGTLTASDVEAISRGGGTYGATVLTAPLLRLRNDHFETPRPFTVTSVHLNRFPGLGAPFARLSGTVDITEGTISGTPEDPAISALVTIPALDVSGETFNDVTARVGYRGHALTLADASVSRNGREIVSIPRASWNATTHVGAADVAVAALSASDVLAILRDSEWLYTTPDGRRTERALEQMKRMAVDWTNATLTLAGSADHGEISGPLHLYVSRDSVSVDGAVQLAGLRMEDQTLDRVSVTGQTSNLRLVDGRLVGNITVPPGGFQADSGDMAVTGQFDGAVGGQVTAVLDAINVPLTYTKLFLPRRYKTPSYAMNGAVTVKVAAEGDWERPEVTASVSGNDITVGDRDIPFGIRTTAIELRNEAGGAVLSARGIRLLTRDHSIQLEGEAPFDWKTKTIPDNRPLNVTATVGRQGLDLLAVVFGGKSGGAVETAKGTVEAQVTLAGTKADPRWTGFAKVDDGTVKLRLLESTFQNITMDLSLDPTASRIVVNTLSVESSTGKGRLVVAPGSTIGVPSLSGGAPSVEPDLKVALERFRLEETPNGLGLGERVRGTLDTAPDAPLLVKNGPRGPLLAGSIILSDVEVLPPNTTPPAIAAGPEPAFVPSFDLTLVVGKNVWVRNPLFRVRMDEKAPLSQRSLQVTNTLTQPRVEGRLTSHEGTFNYPTARFTLTDADIRVHYPAVQDLFGAGAVEGTAAFSISADAQARLMATVAGRRQPVTVYLHVEGPTSAGGLETANGGAFNSLAPYHISLRSSPSLPERQLVALITREEALQQLAQGGNAEDVLRQETMNILQASVLPEALSGLETRLGQAFGLESLSLDYTMANSAVSVTAAKRITDRLVLTYSRPVGDSTAGDAYTVGLSYQLRPRLQLTLQQRKGPLFPSAYSAVPTGEANVLENQILIEGSYPF